MSQSSGQLTPQQLQQINAQARGLIINNSLLMTQQIFSGSFNPATQNVVIVNPRNVGLIRGFLVEIDGTLANGSGSTATRTGFGAMNSLTNVTFNDLNNIVRINTSGRHLGMLNTLRSAAAYGGAYSPTYPASLGANYTVQSAPATIAASGSSALRFFYWVPIAYGGADLRGAIYAATVNATMQLQMTINPNPMIASGDPLTAIYSGNAGGWSGNVTITVYQQYYDQLPTSQGQVLLPPLDLNNYYQLLETNLTGMVPGSDFPYGFANFRDTYSAMLTYDNAGVYNVGTDINYFSLVSSNLTQIFKYTPQVAALLFRQQTLQDAPPGCYWFDFRGPPGLNPINTVNFGNMQLNINPSAVTSGASEYVGIEQFGQITQVSTVSGPSSNSAG